MYALWLTKSRFGKNHSYEVFTPERRYVFVTLVICHHQAYYCRERRGSVIECLMPKIPIWRIKYRYINTQHEKGCVGSRGESISKQSEKHEIQLSNAKLHVY